MLLILCQTVEIGMASKNNIYIHIYICTKEVFNVLSVQILCS